jgi:N-formylmaleamate deformylase
MLRLISAEVIANGTRLHYYSTGGEKPPLILVHGITDDGLCWMPVAEALADKHNVFMVDARGHGKSDAPEGGYTLENLATELAHFIQALGLKKPLVLGHSMGAITALVLAGLFPELPRAILLEDPPAFWSFDTASSRDTESQNNLKAWISGLKRKTWDDLMDEVRSTNPGWSEAELEPWVNSKHRFSPRIIELVSPTDIASINFPDLVKRITCPALLISADPQRGAASREEDIAKLKALLPQLQIASIANAGHSIRRDQFARYMDVVQKALVEFQR